MEHRGDIPQRPKEVPFPPLALLRINLQHQLAPIACNDWLTSSNPLGGRCKALCISHISPYTKTKVKWQLEDMRRRLIEPVPVRKAMEWCTRMVVVAKKTCQPRRTIDYQKLNSACLRETHHSLMVWICQPTSTIFSNSNDYRTLQGAAAETTRQAGILRLSFMRNSYEQRT